VSKFNFWPLTIILMLVFAIVAAVLTIKKAVNNPVQESNLFLANYHIADKNINQILDSQIEFEKKYDLDISKLKFNEKEIFGNISILENGKMIDSDFDIIITRPTSTEFDTNVKNPNIKFEIPKLGRWNIYIKSEVKNLIGYFYLELDTRKPEEILVLNPFISHKRVERIQLEKEKRIQELLD